MHRRGSACSNAIAAQHRYMNHRKGADRQISAFFTILRLFAAVTAKAKGLKIIGLTGQKESNLMKYSDVCIRVPETETYKIQELHLPVYHCLCLMLEDRFFG